MNKEIIKDEIKWLLEAINEQFEAIQEHGDKIPLIEFDILMDNVRKFYESMRLLQRLNEPMPSPEKPVKTNDSVHGSTSPASISQDVTRSVQAEPVAPAMPSASGLTVRFSEPDPPQPDPVATEEPETETMPSGPVQFKPAGPVSGRPEAAPSSKKMAKMPEIDLFASEEPTFSIKLKEAREKSLGPKIPSEHIENLKAAISINEKFMFINELFDGNLREYNETVETLNGFKNLDQAADFLDLMRKKNFWNTGSTAFKKLQDLVERRF
jgi:hypothetical protein